MAVTDDQALALALDAMSSLDSIRNDVSSIKGFSSDILAVLKVESAEVPLPDSAEVSPALPFSADAVAEVVQVQADAFYAFSADLMGFQYMQLVTSVFLLVAVLLNVGATLWLAFSDKWRS